MNIFESVFTSDSAAEAFTLPALLAALGTAFALGLLISVVYIRTRGERAPSQSFALTLVLLPAVITVIILLVGNNIARAFSLAGAFSIIRFRSAPGEPRDITCVLFCMAVGLAAGMGFLLYAAVAGVALCAATVLLGVCGYARAKGAPRQLKITVPEDLNFGGAFDEILRKYTLAYSMKRVKTADLGSVYELTYAVVTKEGISEKDFIDELRVRNGNMNIALLADAPRSEAAEF
ncbi:MAG: DUF4956 domain-containing protein [Oscillospiraceae bacterium]|jgi:hypothetical protein|nr:DUF4956 domain-containing protein [Oscillospiraceae bacterium]